MMEWTEAEVSEGLALRIAATPTVVRMITFDGPVPGERNDASPLLCEAVRQLRAYFAGELKEFRLPLEMAGTDFQKRVWASLLEIPYGETRSYSQIAQAIGAPMAVRAVGAANGENPIAIVVPCHRVIGANGKLTGYGGGLDLKRRLLDMEQGRRLLV